MTNTSITYRSNTNDKRKAVEAAIIAGGLTQIAGGTRNSYFGMKGQDMTGYMIRVGIKAFRIVKRIRSGGKLIDINVGKQRFHGKVDIKEVSAGAERLAISWAKVDGTEGNERVVVDD